MEDRRRRRRHLPPRSPSSLHQYSSLIPLLHHNSATRFFNSLGYGSGSGYCWSPSSSSPLARAAGTSDVAAGGAVGRSSRHARSFSQPSFTPSLLQPSAANRFSSPGSLYGSGHSYTQMPPSPLAAASVKAGGAGAGGSSSSHARSFSMPSFFSTPEPNCVPSSPVASALEFNDLEGDLDLDAADDIVSQYVDLDSLCGLTSGDDTGTGEINGPPPGSQQRVATETSQMSSANINSLAGELESRREEQLLPMPSPWAGDGSSGSRLSRSRSRSVGGAGAAALFELASGMLSEAQMKKIMGNEHLAELMLTDPNRVKRLLANRVSAARMADRKAKIRSELEHRVEMLKMEINTLSRQLTSLQSMSNEIKAENNDMIIKLRSMEKIAHLRDALNETLSSEIEVLKRAIKETRDTQMSTGLQQETNFEWFNSHSGPEQHDLPVRFQQLQMQEQPSQAQQIQPQQPEQFDFQEEWWNS